MAGRRAQVDPSNRQAWPSRPNQAGLATPSQSAPNRADIGSNDARTAHEQTTAAAPQSGSTAKIGAMVGVLDPNRGNGSSNRGNFTLKLPIYGLLYPLSYPYSTSFWLKLRPKQDSSRRRARGAARDGDARRMGDLHHLRSSPAATMPMDFLLPIHGHPGCDLGKSGKVDVISCTRRPSCRSTFPSR